MSEDHKLLPRIAAAVGVVGTIISIWWFALRPRRKSKKSKKS